MMLPDAEELASSLLKQIKPAIQKNTAVIGIHTGGAWLAQRLCKNLPKELPLGLLDISFYRDDFSHAGLHPQIRRSEISFDIEGRDILLIDDVLYTGRTVRAAMNELFDYGRPASIQLVVLVDRGGRELPIEAQYVGAKINLNKGQNIQLNQDSSGKFTLTLHDLGSKPV